MSDSGAPRRSPARGLPRRAEGDVAVGVPAPLPGEEPSIADVIAMAEADTGTSRRASTKLDRAYIRLPLIRDLALQAEPLWVVGKRYNVKKRAVEQFAERYADEIERYREMLVNKLLDETSGLWVAEKRNRLGVLQDQVEEIIEMMANPDKAARAGMQAAEMYRAVQSALKDISEQLGQTPAKTVQHQGGTSVRYVIEGVDQDALT